MTKFKTKCKPVLWIVLVAFLVNTLITEPVQANVPFLPAPGTLVSLTPSFIPPMIVGLKIYKENPFKFEFIMSQGDQRNIENSLAQKIFIKEEAKKLVKYFLASLTIPEKDMWVNLSPYEKDRIVPNSFGLTEMGKSMLAQDYLLKQVTASVMYPEGRVGREFWSKIYQEAYKRFGTTNIPVSTFNKVWIVPDTAVVHENAIDNTAVVVSSKLKVMLEEDYLALNRSSANTAVDQDADSNRQLSNELIRKVILPLIEKEVNTGKNFMVLRQVYNSLILAFWFKSKLKQSLISKGYVDRRKIKGVNVADQNVDQEIYEQYLRSYKKGVYNYIKEDVTPDNEVVPRKYFSGGINYSNLYTKVSIQTGRDSALTALNVLNAGKNFMLDVGLQTSIIKGGHAVNLNLTPYSTKHAIKRAPADDRAMFGFSPKKIAGLVIGLALLTGVNASAFANGASGLMAKHLPQNPVVQEVVGKPHSIQEINQAMFNIDEAYKNATELKNTFKSLKNSPIQEMRKAVLTLDETLKDPGSVKDLSSDQLKTLTDTDHFTHGVLKTWNTEQSKGDHFKANPLSQNLDQLGASLSHAQGIFSGLDDQRHPDSMPTAHQLTSTTPTVGAGSPPPDTNLNQGLHPQTISPMTQSMMSIHFPGVGAPSGPNLNSMMNNMFLNSLNPYQLSTQSGYGFLQNNAPQQNQTQHIAAANFFHQNMDSSGPIDGLSDYSWAFEADGNTLVSSPGAQAAGAPDLDQYQKIKDRFDQENEILLSNGASVSTDQAKAKLAERISNQYSKLDTEVSVEGKHMAVIYSYKLDENMFTPLPVPQATFSQYTGFDNNSLNWFLNQPDVTTEIYEVPLDQNSITDISHIKEWKRLYNGKDIEKARQEKKSIEVLVKWTGDDGKKYEGVLKTGKGVIEEQDQMAINNLMGSILLQAGLKVTEQTTMDDQKSELTNILAGIKPEYRNILPSGLDTIGNFPATAFRVNRDAWGNITNIVGFYDSSKILSKTVKVGPGDSDEIAVLVFRDKDNTEHTLKYWSMREGDQPVKSFSFLTPLEEQKLHQWEMGHKQRGDISVLTTYPVFENGQEVNPYSRGEIVLDDNWAQLLDASTQKLITEQQKAASIYYEHTINREMMINFALLPMDFVSFEGSWLVSPGINWIYDMKREITAPSQKAPSAQQISEFFIPYLKMKDADNPAVLQTKDYHAAARAFVSSVHSDQEIKEMYKYLNSRRNEATATFILNKTISLGNMMQSMNVLPNNNKLLNMVLNGSGEINPANVASLITQGRNLQYLSPLKIGSSSATLLDKVSSVGDVTINVESFFNWLSMKMHNNPLNVPFKNAPLSIRLNFYVPGFQLNQILAVKDAKTLNKILGNEGVKDDEHKYDGYMVIDTLVRSKPYGFDYQQVQELFQTPGVVRIPAMVKMHVGGGLVDVPVYLIQEGDGRKRVLMLTTTGVEHLMEYIKNDIQNYNNFLKATQEGGYRVDYGAEGGTFDQNIWTGVFVSHDIDSDVFFPGAYGWDQYNMIVYALHSGNDDIATGILDKYNSIYETQTMGKQPFGGFTTVINAYTGQVTGPRDTVTTAVIANAILAYKQAHPDSHVYDDMLNGLAKWLYRVYEKSDGIGGLPNIPGNSERYAEPNAILAAFFENYGIINNDHDFTKASEKIIQWARQNLWDGKMMKAALGQDGYSADAQTRWLKFLGPDRFCQVFLGGNKQEFLEYIKRIDATFGVTVKGGNRMLDLADDVYAQKRLETGDKLHFGNIEVTAEWTEVLKNIQGYLGADADPQGVINTLIEENTKAIQAYQDDQGYTPQSTEPDQDSGFGYRTAKGKRSLGPTLEWAFSQSGIDSLRPWETLKTVNLKHIKRPNVVLTREMLVNGTKVVPGAANYEAMKDLIQLLAQREAMSQPDQTLTPSQQEELRQINEKLKNSADRLIYNNPNGEEDVFVLPNGSGITAHPVLIDSIQKKMEYQLLVDNDRVNAELIQKAKAGAPGFESGGVVFVDPLTGGRIGDVRDSTELTRVLQRINSMTVEEQSYIDYRKYGSFLLNGFEVDGQVRNVLVTIFSPLNKVVVSPVLPDQNNGGKPTVSIFENNKLQFKVTDQVVTVFDHDQNTGIIIRTRDYVNVDNDLQKLVEQLLSKKDLNERRDMIQEGQLPINETVTVKEGFVDPVMVTPQSLDPNKVRTVKSAVNDNTGKITTQAYGLFARPVWEADQLQVTDNHSDDFGHFTHSEQYKNIGTVAEPKRGDKLFENRALTEDEVQNLPAKLKAIVQDQKNSTWVYQQDVVHGTDSIMVFDNENFGRCIAKYTVDNFTNPDGKIAQFHTVTIPEYKPDFFGGQIAQTNNVYNANTNKLMKVAQTIDYDPNTQLTIVHEKNVRNGEVIEKTIEPIFGQSLIESKMDALGRNEVITNSYSDDFMHVSSMTVRDGVLAVEAQGVYDPAVKQWTLNQNRWNYHKDNNQASVRFLYETVNSVLSAGGHLIYEDTIYPQGSYEMNGHTYTDDNRRYIPEYDYNGNICRSTEGVLHNGVFVPKQITEFTDYGDFFVAQNSITTRIVDGQKIKYTTAHLKTTPQEYWNDGKLNFEVTSLVYDKSDDPAQWIETSDRDGHVLAKTLQVFDDQKNLMAQQVTHFEGFNVQNTATRSIAYIIQNGAQTIFAISSDKTSLEEAKLGLSRTEISNQFNGLVRQELSDRRGRVIENGIEGADPTDDVLKIQRKTSFFNFNDFDIAQDSITKSLLDGQWFTYTTSKLLSSYEEIIEAHSIRFNVHNDFLSSSNNSVDWQEVKDYRGHVLELDKGHFNGQGVFEITRKISSTYRGIPGLIDVADGTGTKMVVDGKDGIVTDRSHLITPHGVVINDENINTIPAHDIFNSVHKVRYQGMSYFMELEGMTSTDRAYQQIRNNLGNVEITLFGDIDAQGHFSKNHSLYSIYVLEGKNYGNFDIAKSTVGTVGKEGKEEVVSYSNHTKITDDGYLIYRTKKGIGAEGLSLTNDEYANHQSILDLLLKPEHALKLTHQVDTITQAKDAEGREIYTLSGYASLDNNGFGAGDPSFVNINHFDENKVSQPVALNSDTYMWSAKMGNSDLSDPTKIGNFINDGKPRVIARLDQLTFGKGIVTYASDDLRETGLRTMSLTLDGKLFRNYYEGSGVDGPALFNLYFDQHELPSYGMERAADGTEKPYSLYRPTLFDYQNTPYVLVDEFINPVKDANDQFNLNNMDPKSSTLIQNGTIKLVKVGTSVRTTPFSSVVSMDDIERSSALGIGLNKVLPTDPEKALEYGRKHIGDNTVAINPAVSPATQNLNFTQETWGAKTKWFLGQVGDLAGGLIGLYGGMLFLRAFGYSMTASKKRDQEDINSDSQQDYEDLGFTMAQSQIILEERFNNGAFLDNDDFNDRLEKKLNNAHILSEKLIPRMIATTRLKVALKRVSNIKYGIKDNGFNKTDSDLLFASAQTSVKDFMAKLKGIYNLRPEQQASYESAVKMFDKYLTKEQLEAIVASQHFKSLIDKYSKQRAIEVILKLMFEEIRDNEKYKTAVRNRVEDIIKKTGLDKEYPDQIFALKDTFLKNIENARLLPEGLQFHDFDISTDLLAYSWDDLHKAPDMERQVRSNLVSIEKLFVFQVIFQRSLYSLSGQGRAEEYLWAKYVYPSIIEKGGLNDPDILEKIKAFKQVFMVLLTDEVTNRLEANRDPKGKILYFQNIINEEIYNDAFRYLIGQKSPALNDAGWVLSKEVKDKVEPLRNEFLRILDGITDVIGLPNDKRAEAVKKKADELKPVILAFVGAVDNKIGMPVVKGRLTNYWKLTVIPLVKMLTNGEMRRRIFSKGGPYNQTASDMVRRLNNYAVFGTVSVMFGFLAVNMFSLLPFMALPSFIMLPWPVLVTGATSLVSLFAGGKIKKIFLNKLEKKLTNATKEQKESAIKSFDRKLRFLYGAQTVAFLGSLLLTPFLAPFLHLSPHMMVTWPIIKLAIHAIPVLIFVDTWRLSFYAMNYLFSALALHNTYVINNVYEITNKSKTDKIVGRLMSLFTDLTPAVGTAYKTRGQERLAFFIEIVKEMTSNEDGYFFAEDKNKDNKTKLTTALSQLADNLVDGQGKIIPINAADLKEEIQAFVDRLKQPISVDGVKAKKFNQMGLQKLIDYINRNYRLDKGAEPSSWDHVIPLTNAIHGFGEDWYFSGDELIEVFRGNIAKSQIYAVNPDDKTGMSDEEKLKSDKEFLEKLIESGLLQEEENNAAEVRLNPDLNEMQIRAIIKQEGLDFNKIGPVIEPSYHAQKETREFTHRIGMLARYKTELFLNMVNRLTTQGSSERSELLKMIDNPTYVPQGIQKWKIWPEITEWVNLQLPTGYSNAITQIRTVKRINTYHARMFQVANPEAAAQEKFRMIEKNLTAVDMLSIVLTRNIAKSTFEKEFTNGAEIFDWLMAEKYFYEKSGVEGLPRPLKADTIKALKEKFPKDYEKILSFFQEALKDKLREIVDVLIETDYKETYKIYPDGTVKGVKDPYKFIAINQPKIITDAAAKKKYDVIMLNRLMDLVIHDRLFPTHIVNGVDIMNNESHHSSKWASKAGATSPFYIGPVLGNFDADHRFSLTGFEFISNHLLEYYYLPGLGSSTPIIQHSLTNGLGVFGSILPNSENGFTFHSQGGKMEMGGITAYGKFFERVSAWRNSEGDTDSYVAEDSLTALMYRLFGYIMGRAGSIAVEKGWMFSVFAAHAPTRKWIYQTVESSTGRTSMKIFTSIFTDWPYLINNYWLDGFGYSQKEPSIIRYVRWLVVFYLIMDWNLFNKVPLALWAGSFLLSQSISSGLLFHKIYDESLGYVKGTISFVHMIITRMVTYFMHKIFESVETVAKLSINRLGRFISTLSKSANQTRMNNKELIYVRSSFAIQEAAPFALGMLTFVGISFKKAALWLPTLILGFAGVAAPNLLNPVRTNHRLKDNLDNAKDMGVSFWWGLQDNVEASQNFLRNLLSKIGIPYFRNVENEVQVKVLDMVEAGKGNFGPERAASANELAGTLGLFHQVPNHSSDIYGRPSIPNITGLLKILASRVENDVSFEFQLKDFKDSKKAEELLTDLNKRLGIIVPTTGTPKNTIDSLNELLTKQDIYDKFEIKSKEALPYIDKIKNNQVLTPYEIKKLNRLLIEANYQEAPKSYKGINYNAKRVRNELGEYKRALNVYLSEVIQYLNALKKDKSYETQVYGVKNNQLKEAENILQNKFVAEPDFEGIESIKNTKLDRLAKGSYWEEDVLKNDEVRVKQEGVRLRGDVFLTKEDVKKIIEDPKILIEKDKKLEDLEKIWSIIQRSYVYRKPDELYRANWLLTQNSWLATSPVEEQNKISSKLWNMFFSIIGTDSSFQAISFYVLLPVLRFWDKRYRSEETKVNFKKSLAVPNSTPVPLNLTPKTDVAMLGNQEQGRTPINRIAKFVKGGIDLSKTSVKVDNPNSAIQITFNDPEMLRLLLNADGLAPIIYDVRPMTSSMANHFVGLDY